MATHGAGVDPDQLERVAAGAGHRLAGPGVRADRQDPHDVLTAGRHPLGVPDLHQRDLGRLHRRLRHDEGGDAQDGGEDDRPGPAAGAAYVSCETGHHRAPFAMS
jgi:hypothetical protein